MKLKCDQCQFETPDLIEQRAKQSLSLHTNRKHGKLTASAMRRRKKQREYRQRQREGGNHSTRGTTIIATGSGGQRVAYAALVRDLLRDEQRRHSQTMDRLLIELDDVVARITTHEDEEDD